MKTYYITAFIDIDHDNSTFSSSSADLNAPDNENSVLVYAGLYWSANYYMQRNTVPNSFTSTEIPSSTDTNVNFIINNGSLAEAYEARYSDFDNDNSDIQFRPVTSYLVLSEPVNGCGITNGAELNGNIVVVRAGGSCSLREKVVNVQNAGAVGVVIVNDNSGDMPRLEGDGPSITIPSVSIGNDDITNRTATNGDLITLLQNVDPHVILATLSTEGDDQISGLPQTDPRKVGPADFRNIKLKLPNGTEYIDITGSDRTVTIMDGYRNTVTNSSVEAIDEHSYVCYADITDILDPDNYFGTYTVANMNATQGFTSGSDGASGGWFIVAVYENSSEDLRYIQTLDGYNTVASGASPADLNFSGFQTPPSDEAVAVRFGISALDGDASFTGNQLSVQNNDGDYVELANSQNPSNNFFNSTISENDASMLSRIPASQNTQGFDMDILDVSNPDNAVIGNEKSTASFRVSSDADRLSVFFAGLSISNTDILSVDSFKTPLVKVLPNPAKDEISLDTPFYEVAIFDLTGKEVFKTTESPIQIGNLEKGVYFVKIKDLKGNTTATKFMKE